MSGAMATELAALRLIPNGPTSSYPATVSNTAARPWPPPMHIVSSP